jgi:prepilin-type N-terminal cleavage/methylation domain-containing protein
VQAVSGWPTPIFSARKVSELRLGKAGNRISPGDAPCPLRQRGGTQSGLTLLEVLVSVFILSLVLAAVYSAYTGNLESIESARESGERNQIARIVLDRMSKDLESAILRLPVPSGEHPSGEHPSGEHPSGEHPTEHPLGMVAVNADLGDRPADRIDFTSLSCLAPGRQKNRSDLCRIGYFLEESAEEGGFTLYRREGPAPGGKLSEEGAEERPEKGGTSFPLAERIGGLRLSFEDLNGEWADSWDSAETDSLPVAIRIELTVADRIFITSVYPALARQRKIGGG